MGLAVLLIILMTPNHLMNNHHDLPEMSNGFSCPVGHPADTQPPHEQPSPDDGPATAKDKKRSRSFSIMKTNCLFQLG
jgi:hypothetical protein